MLDEFVEDNLVDVGLVDVDLVEVGLVGIGLVETDLQAPLLVDHSDSLQLVGDCQAVSRASSTSSSALLSYR